MNCRDARQSFSRPLQMKGTIKMKMPRETLCAAAILAASCAYAGRSYYQYEMAENETFELTLDNVTNTFYNANGAARGHIFVAESGVRTHADVELLRAHKVNAALPEEHLRVKSGLQIVTPCPAHILDDPCPHEPLFYKVQPFLHAGTIEVCSGVAVIYQYL